MTFRLAIALVVFTLISGCATGLQLHSERLDAAPTTPIEGIIYHLPRTILRITSKPGEVNLTKVDHVADTTAVFLLEGTQSAFSDDSFDFMVSDGLLGSVNANNEDQSAAIASTLADRTGEILAQPRTSSGGVTGFFNRNTGTTVEFALDPLKKAHVHIMGHEINITPVVATDLFDRIEMKRRDWGSCSGASLCVPVTTPLEVSIKAPDDSLYQNIIMAVDPTRAIGIRLNRVACAKSESAITLSDGILTKFDIGRPSEVAKCLSIPLDVISAILSAPFDAITGRTSGLKKEKELIDAQVNLLKAREALLVQQSAVQTGN